MLKLALIFGVMSSANLAAPPADSLNGYVDAMKAAQSLKASYTVTIIGGESREYSVELSKPNLMRFDSPSQQVIADGTNITTFDKAAKTYYKKPQSDAEIFEMLNGDELSIFAGFFNEKAFKDLKTTTGGSKNRKGMKLDVVNGTFRNGKTVAFYLDAKSLARQLELTYPDTKQKTLVDTKDLVLGDKAGSADQFAFKAPEGSRELTLDELMSDRWFTDIEEARKVAVKTNRLLFVDFYADW